MATRRYLVIANQTLAEVELTEAIRQRLEAGPSLFYVLVPNTRAGDLAARIARVPLSLPPSATRPSTVSPPSTPGIGCASSWTTFAAWVPTSTATSGTQTR